MATNAVVSSRSATDYNKQDECPSLTPAPAALVYLSHASRANRKYLKNQIPRTNLRNLIRIRNLRMKPGL
ncbi:MAG: hypothetical protein JWM43_1419 [Acidobacteriaceae bacterium]|nr:hypothetical protein [Acidobacteriaceae bacterium]